MEQRQEQTVGDVLIDALLARGVRHVCGVPGDSMLDFLGQLERHKSDEVARGGTRYLDYVNFCDEQGAGFAADAYARVRGLGVLCVTWGVGGLKVANPVGGAYAEESPVLVVSGAPKTTARGQDALLHHKVRAFDTQQRVFAELTAGTLVIEEPRTAAEKIAAALDLAVSARRPVYLEIPADLFAQPCPPLDPAAPSEAADTATSDPAALRAAVDAALALMLNPRTASPVVLAGVEIHRLGLQDALKELIDRTNLPVAANMLGKSVIDERHPGYVGTYWGRLSRDDVRRRVEESDCVLQLGVWWTDFERGFAPPPLDPERSIQAERDRVKIGHATYENVGLGDFLREFSRRLPWSLPPPEPQELPAWIPTPDRRVTVARLYEALNVFLTDDTLVVSDVGDCLFAARDLRTHRSTEFLSPAYYLSMGFAVPASIGAQLALRAAGREVRPLVLVGDGAFQMTGIELATALRFGCNPIVVLLDNDGYTTERYLVDGSFNDLLRWDYSRLSDLLRDDRLPGQGRAARVETEGDLDAALRAARDHHDGFFLLDVRLDRMDGSDAVRKLWAHA
jgi:TPP-dependent 2-oxoacid decarboxylase